MLSFRAIGIPNVREFTSLPSNSSACFKASSLFRVIKQFKSLLFSILSKASSTKSLGVIFFSFNNILNIFVDINKFCFIHS